VKDLADLLKVCTATVYKMVDRLHIPHFRVLNSIRFRRGDVKRFVEAVRR
jgi:excisionase family DNA binding protein